MYDDKKTTQLKRFNNNIIGFGTLIILNVIVIKSIDQSGELYQKIYNSLLTKTTPLYFGILLLLLGLYIRSKLVKISNK